MSTATDITRKAGSNLALALRILPKDQRHDLEVFYACCRTIDGLADDGRVPMQERAAALEGWRRGLIDGFAKPDALQQELMDLLARRELPRELLVAIVDGCLMDLHQARYGDWEALDGYMWKVASAVGLVCIELFGCRAPESKTYATALGKALQLTNILRDVGEDLRERDRIYLPLQDLHQFGCTEQSLKDGVQDERFRSMMAFHAARARELFEEAELNLTATDHVALRPARIMADIYRELLEDMAKDGFQVLTKRYRISKARKLLIMAKHLMA
ncbi:MAG TPA: squalene/phytoene synthase family protein [Luteolibacter sp.]|nr:squalene/phytoene synthase family protein [Luteolibacter sp.]